MNNPNKAVLSVVSFFLFVVFGLTMPIISLYLVNYLGFTGTQAGIILSTSAISAFVSPILGTLVADRFISAEKVFSICLIISGILMGILFTVETFHFFLVIFLLYMIFMGPTATLLNTIIFHHVSDRKKDYGKIRVWGTIGWIAAGWFLGFFILNSTSGEATGNLEYALIISSFAAIILGIATFFIPSEKRADDIVKNEGIIPVSSLMVIKNKQVIILTLVMFLSFVCDRFYQYGAALFLKDLGFSEAKILPSLTLGQISEIPAMIFLGWLISRFGLKGMVIFGSIFSIARYSLFFVSFNLSCVYSGIFLHGPAYTFVFSTAFIMLDLNCSKKDRAGVHQLFGILTGGIGGLVGSILAGVAADVGKTASGDINFHIFWVFPLVISVLIAVIVFVLLKDPEKTTQQSQSDTDSALQLRAGEIL